MVSKILEANINSISGDYFLLIGTRTLHALTKIWVSNQWNSCTNYLQNHGINCKLLNDPTHWIKPIKSYSHFGSFNVQRMNDQINSAAHVYPIKIQLCVAKYLNLYKSFNVQIKLLNQRV